MRLTTALKAVALAIVSATPIAAQSTTGIVTESSVSPDPAVREQSGGESLFSLGGAVGYQDGLSLQAHATASDFASGFPVQARLRLGYTALEPGSSSEARRIFINNATNGTPEKSGSTWDLALDGLYPVGVRTHLYGGVRYARFRANFKYIGGNEDFDVTSGHWGLGAGLQMSFRMGARSGLLIGAGADYFFQTRLTGHDTSYSPDGDDVNPRENFAFNDADEAINQPKWRPAITMGFSYRLGR